MYEAIVEMIGLQNYKRIEIPAGYHELYKYLTIVNITDNTVCIYPRQYTTPTPGKSIVCVGVYSILTIPIGADLKPGFSVVWTNPSGTNLDKTKTVRIILSETNLNYNASFAPSFTSGGDVVNTALVFDEVGLAKAAQLPNALSTGGNLKVALIEDALNIAKASQLPNALTIDGNLKTAVAEPLPTGTNVIGAVTLPGSELTLLASAARTASGDTSATPVDVTKYKEITLFLDVTAVSGTTPTLDVVVKTRDPVSLKWFDLVTFTQATDVKSEMKTVAGNLGSKLAVFYTIGGTTPSFTFSLGAVTK